MEHLEKDSKNAIAKWFELLDDYLVSLGYEPIPQMKPGETINGNESLLK